jgi:hypothetical protein
MERREAAAQVKGIQEKYRERGLRLGDIMMFRTAMGTVKYGRVMMDEGLDGTERAYLVECNEKGTPVEDDKPASAIL